jgi:hypothetical protein
MEPDPRATAPSRAAVADTARLPTRRRAVPMDTPGCKGAPFVGPASRVDVAQYPRLGAAQRPDRGDAVGVAVGVDGGKPITLRLDRP